MNNDTYVAKNFEVLDVLYITVLYLEMIYFIAIKNFYMDAFIDILPLQY